MDDKKISHSEASKTKRDASPDKRIREGKSSKLQQPTSKHYMTPLMAKARLTEITAKLFPNEVKNKGSVTKRPSSANKARPSSASSVAPTVYSTTSATSKQVSVHSTGSMASRRSATPTSKVNQYSSALYSHHPPFCAMIPPDRIVAAASSPSSSPISQRGVTPPRKTSQSLLNHPYNHNNSTESKMPIFFANDSLVNLAAATISPESNIVQTKAYLPNEQGKLQPISMTMMMVPNQALLFALTQQQFQQEMQHSSSKIADSDKNISQIDQVSHLPGNITVDNVIASSDVSPIAEQVTDKQDHGEPIITTTEPERSNSPSLVLSEKLTHSLRISSQPDAAEIPSNLPSRLARRAIAKGVLHDQQQRRLQLQRINLSKHPNSVNNNSKMNSEQDQKPNDVANVPSSHPHHPSSKNPLQVALSKTAVSHNPSANSVSNANDNTHPTTIGSPPTAEKAKSKIKQQRPVWLSPRHFNTYRPLQKHAWSPSATASSSSARRYDRKQASLSPSNADQENEIDDEDETSSDIEENANNINHDNCEKPDSSSTKEPPLEKFSLSPSSENNHKRNENNVEIHENEEEDDGLFGFGKLLQAHSKKQLQSHIKQEESQSKAASNHSESIFCLTSPNRTSMTQSPTANEVENANDKAETGENDGCFYPLSAKERRQRYYLQSTKVLEEAILRHQRYRKLFFLHQLRRQVQRNSHQWQLLQRGKLFHESIIRTSRVFTRWIDFTRRKQVRRQRMLQSKVPLFVTKLLVSSTETIVAYLEVNQMKSSFQRWREWTKIHHPLRKKSRYILQYLDEEKLFHSFKKWKRYRDDVKRELNENGINVSNSYNDYERQKEVNPLLKGSVSPSMVHSENNKKKIAKDGFIKSVESTEVDKISPVKSKDGTKIDIADLTSTQQLIRNKTQSMVPQISQNDLSFPHQEFTVPTTDTEKRKQAMEEKKDIQSLTSDHVCDPPISPLTTVSEATKDRIESFPPETLPTIVNPLISTEGSPSRQIIRLNELMRDYGLSMPSTSSISPLQQASLPDEVSTMVVDLANGDSASTISTTLKPSKEYFFSTASFDNEDIDVEDYDSARIDLKGNRPSAYSMPANVYSSALTKEYINSENVHQQHSNNKTRSTPYDTVADIDYIPPTPSEPQQILGINNDADRQLSPSPTISDADDHGDYFPSAHNTPGNQMDDEVYNDDDAHLPMPFTNVGNSMDRLLEMYSSRNDSLLAKLPNPPEDEAKKEEESRPPMTIQDMEAKVSALMRSPSEVRIITPTSKASFRENNDIVVDLEDAPASNPFSKASSDNVVFSPSQQLPPEHYANGIMFDNNAPFDNHPSTSENLRHFEEDEEYIPEEEEDVYYEDDFENVSDEHYHDYTPHDHLPSDAPYQQKMTVSHTGYSQPEHDVFLREDGGYDYDDGNGVNNVYSENFPDHRDIPTQYFVSSMDNDNHQHFQDETHESNPPLSFHYRANDEQDIVNQSVHYDAVHSMEMPLPMYDGEELMENTLYPPIHGRQSSPGHGYDTLEDSETSFLTGRKAPFAAFQDEDLPPLPDSPYRGHTETDDGWNETAPHKDGFQMPPRFPQITESLAADFPQETVSESRCWTPFIIGDDQSNHHEPEKEQEHITLHTEGSETAPLTATLPVTFINNEDDTNDDSDDTLLVQQGETHHATRRQRVAFYHLVQTLLLRSLQRQVLRHISVPAAMRLALRRGLCRWCVFTSEQKEKRFRHIQSLQQQQQQQHQQQQQQHHPSPLAEANVHRGVSYPMHTVPNHLEEDQDNDEEEEYYPEDDYEDDEYAAYRDYADDQDDVIRIIDISEL